MVVQCANTHKWATMSGTMIDNEPRLPKILDINATNSATMENMLVIHFLSLQEIINKQGEEIRKFMKENAKLQIVIMKVIRKLLQNLKKRFKNVKNLHSKQMSPLTRLIKEEKVDRNEMKMYGQQSHGPMYVVGMWYRTPLLYMW